ncbi:MAG TPA: DUF1990 family protein [Baekduia sp.]|nr:DUF1990 family protein [Baekduia sp.]
MPRRPPLPHRLATAATWPVGMAVTSYAYIWRTTVLHRRELGGSMAEDGPPPFPPGADLDEVQTPEHGSGDLMHRTYRSRIRESELDARGLMARVCADPNVVAPNALARFQKVEGPEGRMAVGDEFSIRMPGPWDGPVRCIRVDDRSFRFATLEGHLEAGQVEWAAADLGPGLVAFRVESWSAPGDRLSNLMHHHLRMAKEVQLHMWTSVHERVAKLCGGRLDGGIDIETRTAAVPRG